MTTPTNTPLTLGDLKPGESFRFSKYHAGRTYIAGYREGPQCVRINPAFEAPSAHYIGHVSQEVERVDDPSPPPARSSEFVAGMELAASLIDAADSLMRGDDIAEVNVATLRLHGIELRRVGNGTGKATGGE